MTMEKPMTRLCAAGVAALATMLASGDASAIEFGTPASVHPYRSAQNFALELRFAPYYPRIDQEPGLRGTPFRDRFGDNARFYIGLEFDWQTFRIPHVGTIGPGVSVGRVSMSREARTVSGAESGDSYSLDIYPMYLAGVLRADALWRDAGVPLVPYGKLGLAWAPWVASNTGGTSEAPDGTKGRGSTLGTNAALGVAFALDVIDQGANRNMDNAIGINNTYIYAELYWLMLNGLGQGSALHVGSNSWAAGLAFEF
jgi:hypothetical protein